MTKQNNNNPNDDQVERTNADPSADAALENDSSRNELEMRHEESWALRGKVAGRVRRLEPRDWSNYVEPLGMGGDRYDGELDFLRRCSQFLDRYDDRLNLLRHSIAGRQGWQCFYDKEPHYPAVLRAFGPVVHRGIECADRASDGGCQDMVHHVVACMNHASALLVGDRTDAELREAMQGDPILERCYPITLLPSGHGWCGTGITSDHYSKFSDPGYRPGGWDGTGDYNAQGVYGAETAFFGGR